MVHVTNKKPLSYWREKVECTICHKKVSRGYLTEHHKSKKCKNYNDKTTGKPPIISPKAADDNHTAAPVESKLIIVNLKQEYDKNMETLNPKEKKGKEKKYQCGACGCMFDNLNDGKCPDCEEQLQ